MNRAAASRRLAGFRLPLPESSIFRQRTLPYALRLRFTLHALRFTLHASRFPCRLSFFCLSLFYTVANPPLSRQHIGHRPHLADGPFQFQHGQGRADVGCGQIGSTYQLVNMAWLC